jgi:hypothetical protein
MVVKRPYHDDGFLEGVVSDDVLHDERILSDQALLSFTYLIFYRNVVASATVTIFPEYLKQHFTAAQQAIANNLGTISMQLHDGIDSDSSRF